MHPALSIIVFTTASGLGYGLAAVLGLGLLDPAAISTKLAHMLALALIGGGLLSSTLHLGNPQRAWRALSQWRTSWLSREGVMAILTFVPLTLAAFAAIFQSRHLPAAGLAGTLGAAVTVWCTSMIYASLRSVQAWNTKLTPAFYLLFAAAGGALLATLFATLAGEVPVWLGLACLVLLVAGWAVRIAWRVRAATEQPLSTPETATGLGAIGRVRLFEAPHGTDNYLTREMGFRIARKHADKLFAIALCAGGVAPALLLVVAMLAGGRGLAIFALGLATLAHVAGVLIERWLFFAEAKHAMTNYYDRRAT